MIYLYIVIGFIVWVVAGLLLALLLAPRFEKHIDMYFPEAPKEDAGE